MKQQFVLLTALVMCMLITPTGQSEAQDQATPQYQFLTEREVLRGVRSVYVLIEDLSEDAMDAGLTQGTLQTDVEVKLRTAGITVASDENRWLAENIPNITLYVNANIMKAAYTPNYAVNISVEVWDLVILYRDGNPYFTTATIWSGAGLGLYGENWVRDDSRQKIKDYVDEFINDYLAENPKK